VSGGDLTPQLYMGLIFSTAKFGNGRLTAS